MRRMTSHVAVAIAGLALGAAATAGAASLIDGSRIKDGTIEAKKLSKKARATLKGARGPRGLRGLTGTTGAQGPAGAGGPQGPAGPGGSAGASGTNGTPGASGVAGPSIVMGTMGFPNFAVPGGGNTGTLATAQVPIPAGSSYTAKSFVVRTTVAPGGANQVIVAFQINGVDTALKCAVVGAQTSCSPPGGTAVVVPVGALISMQSTVVGAPAAGIASYAFRAEF